MKHYYVDTQTPLGNFCMIIECDEKGREVVVASGFSSLKSLQVRYNLPGKLEGYRGAFPYAGCIGRYFSGEADALKKIPVEQKGSAFETAVWKAIAQIKRGSTASYKAIAMKIGHPKAVRVVGSACGKNMLVLLVPCHRVVRSDGGLGGYVYGNKVKTSLLALESK